MQTLLNACRCSLQIQSKLDRRQFFFHTHLREWRACIFCAARARLSRDRSECDAAKRSFIERNSFSLSRELRHAAKWRRVYCAF